MSGTAKKWIAYVGGALFLVAAATLKWAAMPSHPHPELHDDCELLLIVLGMAGITAPFSIMNPNPKDKS